LTLADTAENVRDGDSSHLQVAVSELGMVPAERLHPNAAYSRVSQRRRRHGGTGAGMVCRQPNQAHSVPAMIIQVLWTSRRIACIRTGPVARWFVQEHQLHQSRIGERPVGKVVRVIDEGFSVSPLADLRKVYQQRLDQWRFIGPSPDSHGLHDGFLSPHVAIDDTLPV